jgi:hypothetical protein
MRNHRIALKQLLVALGFAVAMGTLSWVSLSNPPSQGEQQWKSSALAVYRFPIYQQPTKYNLAVTTAMQPAIAEFAAIALDNEAAQAFAQASAAVASSQTRTETGQSAPASISTPTAGSGDSGWQQVAICEEGGRNDPTYGYFGIMPSSWAAQGMSGTAGDYDWATQVAVGDRINGGGPPWCPPSCSAGGYRGW